MNQYKFRAWHKLAKEMLYEPSTGKVFTWIEQGQPIDIEMWTGLHDKTGKEIYEGDIVIGSYFESEIVFGRIGYDSRWNGMTGFALKINEADYGGGIFYELEYGDSANEFEVIGNVHEGKQ